MQITQNMDLNQLPFIIHDTFSPQELACLRSLLTQTKYQTVEAIPQAVWLSILERIRIQFQPVRKHA